MHTLQHALDGCTCDMKTITNCVICEKRLDRDRTHTDTCSETCFRALLKKQRAVHSRE